MFHMNGTIIALTSADSSFIPEHHFHPIDHTSWLFLFNPRLPHFLLFMCLYEFSFIFSLSKTYFIRLISYSLVININYYFDLILFPSFCFTFSIIEVYWFDFSLYILWCLSWSISVFPFLNHCISFIIVPNFRQSWQGTSNVFRHTPLLIAFLNKFYDSFHFSGVQSAGDIEYTHCFSAEG